MRHWIARLFAEWRELVQIKTLLQQIKQEIKNMAGELDDLKTKVAKNTEVVDSAITLLQGLKAKLDAAGTDPVALKALSDELGTKDQQLADAVVANTPAA